MSTPVITNTNVQIDNVDIPIVKVKSIRPPSLSGKYSKFLLFGFQLIEQLKTHNLLSDIDASYQLLSLFSNVEDQTEYFENFFLNIKSSTKEMKSVLKDKLNANKPVKAKKCKSTITPTILSNDVVLADANASEKKRGRKKKDNTVVHDKQDQIVIDLLALANDANAVFPSSDIITSTETSTSTLNSTLNPDDTTAPKYKRDKSKKNSSIDATKEHIQTINASTTNEDKPKSKPKNKLVVVKPTTPIIPVVQPILPVVQPILPVVQPKPKPETDKKTKTKTEKKTKTETEKKTKTKTDKKLDVPLPIQPELVQQPLTVTVAVAAPTNLQLILPADNDKEEEEEGEEEEEEEITTEPFIYEGIHYLKDENHIVYHRHNFDVIGKYNKHTNTIVPIGLDL